MTKAELPGGTVHKMPSDLRRALTSAPAALTAWQSLTPLARNEWICWTVTVKQQKTRDEHVNAQFQNSKMECDALVAGSAASIVRIRLSARQFRGYSKNVYDPLSRKSASLG